MTMFLLPTRSPRKYRGKYPKRVNSWSYSRAPSQVAIAEFLNVRSIVHLELNDGTRYVADRASVDLDQLHIGCEFNKLVFDNAIELGQERYDRMLKLIKELR